MLVSVAPVVGGDMPVKSVLVVDCQSPPIEIATIAGEIRGLWLDGRVYIGGQPDQSALKFLHERGVTAVVNLRTPEEMNDRELVPYDEAAQVASLGMEYVQIPLGGEDYPYTTEAISRFVDVLKRHEGPVLLHCTAGWRASYVWAAALVRENGFDISTAIDRGKAMAIGDLPIEGLLGTSLQLVPVR
jgi:uncharacterized protein (TIGR01244 family)